MVLEVNEPYLVDSSYSDNDNISDSSNTVCNYTDFEEGKININSSSLTPL